MFKHWLDDSTAIQINLPEKPFNRPAGGAYVGPGHGIDGSIMTQGINHLAFYNYFVICLDVHALARNIAK